MEILILITSVYIRLSLMGYNHFDIFSKERAPINA